MPISTAFTRDGAGLLRTVQGTVTGADFVAAETALLSEQQTIAKLRYALLDFGDATEFSATADEVRLIAKRDAELAALNSQVAVAIIAPRDVQFGMSRMWEVFVDGSGWETAVFRDSASAVAWLYQRVPGASI